MNPQSATWLRFLPMEMDAVEKLIEPRGEPEPTDQPLGEVTVGLRRLYSLAVQLQKQAALAQVDAQYGDSEGTHARLDELEDKGQVTLAIFWVCLKDEMHLWGMHIQVRKGWQVVRVQPPRMPPFLRFLGGGQP